MKRHIYPELDNNYVKIVKKKLKAISKKDKKKKIVTQSQCISYGAVHEEDELCIKVVDFLIGIIGYLCQRLAVTTMCTGGIYMGGGVINYLSEYLEKKQQLFWEPFINNKIMKASLEKIPIFIMRKNLTLEGLEAMIMNQ